ncbi:MAG: glycosyltransferase family 4 protein [Cyanobacteria bacterium P01_D01_bin.128]
MHIVVLETEPSSRRGGQELSLLDVCHGLAERGCEITFVYTEPGNLLPDYKAFCNACYQVSAYRFYPRRSLSSLWTLGRDIFKIPLMPDSIIYSNQYHDSVFGAAFARLRRIPFVCHLRVPPGLPLGIQWSWSMGQTNRLIAVSEQTRTDWQTAGFGHKPIDVVYNAIDTEKFQPSLNLQKYRDRWGLSIGDRVIAYVGRLDRVKGIETLLQAFAQVAQENARGAGDISFHLLIAGKPLRCDETYEASLKQLATALGIAEQIHFLGHVDDPRWVYHASDLVVLPSHWPEPFGRVLIEGMACGVPAIGSAVGGIPEVLRGLDYPALFAPEDVEALAERISDVIHWRSRCPDWSDRCRRYVQSQFPLEKTITGIQASLHQVLV